MLKVDNIISIEEILELNNLKIDIISITLKNKSYNEERAVNINEAIKLRKYIKKDIKFCIEIDNTYTYIENEKNILKIIKILKPNYIQLRSNTLISRFIIEKLRIKNIFIIYVSRNSLDRDEEIYWQLPSFANDTLTLDDNIIENIFLKYNISIQVDIMTEYDDSWNILNNDCGKYEDDITINEIYEFTIKFNTFILLNYSINNFNKIKNIFKKAVGYSFRLGTKNEIPTHITPLKNISKIIM